MTQSRIPLERHDERITACHRCPRLVDWRKQVAKEKVKRFADFDYWGKAVPSFGPVSAGLLVVGLAPAAHGANRTGRMFTGDRSGDWLYRAMHKAGFATQASSEHAGDGLELVNARITAVCHCAPPGNKPEKEEIANCRPYLWCELKDMPKLRVVIGLGKIAFDAAIDATGKELPGLEKNLLSPRPKFGHGATVELPGGLTLIGSYHPSQQNTFTGKLTEEMLDEVFRKANGLLQAR